MFLGRMSDGGDLDDPTEGTPLTSLSRLYTREPGDKRTEEDTADQSSCGSSFLVTILMTRGQGGPEDETDCNLALGSDGGNGRSIISSHVQYGCVPVYAPSSRPGELVCDSSEK
jgi:hypothetical protein